MTYNLKQNLMIKQKDFSRYITALLIAAFTTLASVAALADEVNRTVELAQAGTLSGSLTDEEKTTVTNLTVTGEVNSDDVALMKTMATTGALSVLDMSGATAATADLIGRYAFEKCTKLTSVSLPQGITSIGYCAFFDCDALASVSIPDGVTTYGESAFWLCTSLKSITIPEGVTVISKSMLESCKSLVSVTFPKSVTSFGDSALQGCSSLSAVSIPEGVTSFGTGVFLGCYKLQSVTIPDGVNSLPEDMFSGCSDLKSVTLGSGITSIGARAFQMCWRLPSIIIPDRVETIGGNAFSNCSALTSVTLGSRLKSIESCAFLNCSKLPSLVIPDSVTNIGAAAFGGCTVLREVTLQSNVLPATCSEDIFTNVDLSIATLYCAPVVYAACSETAPWSGFGKTVDTTIRLVSGKHLAYYISDDTKYTLAELKLYGELNTDDISLMKDMSTNGTLSQIDMSEATASKPDLIGSSAFEYCTKLTTITFPPNITSLGRCSFSECTSLTSVTIPETVTTLGSQTFNNCTSLTSIHLPDAITKLGYLGFYKTPLKSVTIPKGVKKITKAAFEDCDELTSVVFHDEVECIDAEAFQDCDKLAEINLPSSIKTFGEKAFFHCDALKSVVIPDSVTDIPNSLFAYCRSMTSLTLNKNLKTIGSCAFIDVAIGSLNIPEGVTTIGSSAFQLCRNMGSVTIPSTVTSIGSYAFASCYNMFTFNLRCATLPTCGDNMLYYSFPERYTLYCASSLVEKCKTTAPWNEFGTVKANAFSVSLSSAGIATGCFDGDLDASELRGAGVYIAVGFNPDDGKVLLSKVDHVPAGTGFLVKGDEGEYAIPYSSNSYLYVNMLKGTLEETSVSATDGSYANYILANHPNYGVGFYPPADGYTLPANKAYLRVPLSQSEAKSVIGLSFDDDGSTTGFIPIEELAVSSGGNASSAAIYNLQGQRLKGFTRGLNIVNGKKVFVR